MNTDKIPSSKGYYFLSILALYLLSLSFFVSITLGAISQAIILFLSFFLFRNIKILYEFKSSIFLILLILSGLISELINFKYANLEISSLFKLKYYAFPLLTILVINNLTHFKKYPRQIYYLFFFLGTTIVSIVLVGIIQKYFLPNLNLVYISEGEFRVGGLVGIMKHGYGLGFLAPVFFSLLINITIFRKIKYLSIAIATIFIFSFVGVYMSGDRGALLGSIVGILYAVSINYKKTFYLSIFLTASCSVFFIFVIQNNSLSGNRYFQKINSPSNMIRISLWKSALFMIKDHPTFGLGSDQFEKHVQAYKIKHEIAYKNEIRHNAHNSILEAFVSYGFIGGTFFLLWLFYWWKEARTELETTIIYCPFLVSLIVSGQFNVFQYGTTMFIVCGTYSFFLGLKKPKLHFKNIE